ncbi:hypothetical protein BDC45DRAFT_550534 [Circinella umbellata]|nr:hypothetical protein BDC45DRAFT_550534 [Circinella umbellata]
MYGKRKRSSDLIDDKLPTATRATKSAPVKQVKAVVINSKVIIEPNKNHNVENSKGSTNRKNTSLIPTSAIEVDTATSTTINNNDLSFRKEADTLTNEITSCSLSKVTGDITAHIATTTSTSSSTKTHSSAKPMSAIAARKAAAANAIKNKVTPISTTKTANKDVSPKPMSAIAARKAAAAAATAASAGGSTFSTSKTVSTTATVLQKDNVRNNSTPESPNNLSNWNTSSPLSQTPSPRSDSPGVKTFRRREPRISFKDPNAISIFNPSEKNVQSVIVDEEPCLIIGLKPDEKIVFAGKALIAPLSGSISIMGSILQPSSPNHIDLYPTYSPRTHSLLVIQSITDNDKDTIQRKSNIRISTDDSIKSTVNNMRDAERLSSLFLVMGMQWCGLDDMEDLAEVPRGIFQLKTTNDEQQQHENEHKQHFAMMDSIPGFQPLFSLVSDIKAMDIPIAWENCVQKIQKSKQERQSPCVGIVCGSKDMGKSTFSRYLMNALLNKHQKIAYLETDVGQSEFTPSGMVSLHIIESPIMGPPYTHQHLSPIHSHYIGSVTSGNNPGYYLDTIGHLLQLYKTNYHHLDIPLIINTQGWINGLGYDLLLSIIQQSTPTDVFVMHSQLFDQSKNLPVTFAATISPSSTELGEKEGKAMKKNMHYLECVVDPLAPNTRFFSATSSRELAMVSYLHQDLNHFGRLGQPWWNFQTRIVDKLPWVLDWRKGLLNGIWFLSEDVPQSQLLYALNGTIVALVGFTDQEQQKQQTSIPEVSNGQITPPLYFGPSENPPPSPAKTICYGLAIIRAIDPMSHAFHIITPLPLSTLTKVSAIVKGTIPLPVSTLLDQHNGNGNGIARQPWNKVPYLEQSMAVNGIGAIATKKRRIKIQKRT